MKKHILVACEESQRLTTELRKLGINAYSCDLLETSGDHPEWHIVGDVLPLLNGFCKFTTQDGTKRKINKRWDAIIAFPPCTYLTVSGNSWFNVVKYGDKAIKRMYNRADAIQFFFRFVNADCNCIAIENPIGIMSSVYRKPDQIIQPYYFGDNQRKSTCLWIKNLPLLYFTNVVEPNIIKHKNGKSDPQWHFESLKLPKEERAKTRSKTFRGIAKAMANQWGNYILNLV